MSGFCPHCGFNISKDDIVDRGRVRWDPRGGFQYDGRAIKLEPQQHIIVGSLLTANGRVVSKDTLLLRLDTDADQKILDTRICQIRRKLRAYGADAHIVTTWGRGYAWRDDAREAA